MPAIVERLRDSHLGTVPSGMYFYWHSHNLHRLYFLHRCRLYDSSLAACRHKGWEQLKPHSHLPNILGLFFCSIFRLEMLPGNSPNWRYFLFASNWSAKASGNGWMDLVAFRFRKTPKFSQTVLPDITDMADWAWTIEHLSVSQTNCVT